MEEVILRSLIGSLIRVSANWPRSRNEYRGKCHRGNKSFRSRNEKSPNPAPIIVNFATVYAINVSKERGGNLSI